MTSKQRALASLNHREPDAVPVDFGSTAVTGIHVNALAGLRDHYGLEKRPVKVYEPYQMLGLVEEDLKKVMGIDVEGIPAPETLFGFRNEDWKTYRLDSGLEVFVSAHFRTNKAPNGDTLIYPKGDLSAPPSGRMPRNGFFFDTIVRQDPIDDARLNPEDNLEEFGPISPRDLDYF
ncbi:MAG: methylcobalamin:coenzyme methyltransferase, partial [Candidatus Aminicenantes bacterium]|nr:methylcobalamin:coenzyme methyltransferase [Candidatus Aminicenantes bacterium]